MRTIKSGITYTSSEGVSYTVLLVEKNRVYFNIGNPVHRRKNFVPMLNVIKLFAQSLTILQFKKLINN